MQLNWKQSFWGCIFWENTKMDYRIDNNSFFFLKSKTGSRLWSIHTWGGYFGSNLNLDLWDSWSWSMHLFGKRFKKSYFSQAVFHAKYGKQQMQCLWVTCSTLSATGKGRIYVKVSVKKRMKKVIYSNSCSLGSFSWTVLMH